MPTFASPLYAPSVAPSVAAWIGSLAAPWTTFFTSGPGRPAPQQAAVNAVASDTPQREVRPVGPTLHADRADGASTRTDAGGGATAGLTYWPCERLNAFILQMAAHGHCVSAAMMLGHRPYAVQQLAAAQQVPDEGLRSVAAELQSYFDAPPDAICTAGQPLAGS